MLTLQQIWIYPIKSLPGIQVSSSRILEKGLEHDRRLMLIDNQNRFMTQRTRPEMCLFDLTLRESRLSIRDKRGLQPHSVEVDLMATEALDVAKATGQSIQATIWDDEVEVFEIDGAISGWFSKVLGESCRLVTFPEEKPRRIDPDFCVEEKQVSLADGYPLLMISQESLDLLNSKLSEPVPMIRFRPNLVVSGGRSHEEDSLRRFRIGRNIFAAVKPCARCVLTTVDPETGKTGEEPLKTLSAYRKLGNKVNFGMNIIPLEYETLQEGDEVCSL